MYGLQTSLGLYLPGQGHTHMGPGTSFVQRIDWTQAQNGQMLDAMRGLGCGSCAGTCQNCRTRGLGLFESGMDFSGWGPLEWGLVALGGYMVVSTVFTTQRASTRVRKSFKKFSRRRAVQA
jgi:hypothetical protein